MKGSQETIWVALDLIETNSQITETDGDGVAVGDKFYGVNHTLALYAGLLFHFSGVIDANNLHISLEHDHLINLLEIVNLLNLAIMRSPIDDVCRLRVLHVHLSGIFSVILNLMLDQIGSQIRKLDSWRICFIRPIKEVH